VGRVRLLVAVAAAALVGGCSQVVPGTATTPGQTTPPTLETLAQGVPGAPPAPTTPPPGSASDGPLVPDVTADECLLTAGELTALLGVSVQPAQATVAPNESVKVPSCVATTTAGPATPAGVVNVYAIRGSTPAEYVRGRTGRVLSGVGEAAIVVRTGTATVLQAARGPFLVTISALGTPPSDDAWRAAGNAALGRLPS
jgi:hypothetical protein